MKKQYLKSSPHCRVTLSICKEAAGEAEEVSVSGDFNEWSERGTRMRRLKNGSHTLTLKLATGRAYSFRYLIDGEKWENDWAADRYEPNPYGGDNSVVEI